jgi:hypothetical protein
VQSIHRHGWTSRASIVVKRLLNDSIVRHMQDVLRGCLTISPTLAEMLALKPEP